MIMTDIKAIDISKLNWGTCPCEGRLVKAWLDAAPTVEAKPVIHAKWNYDGTCDNCKAQVLSNHTKFCPACGAKMDGE
jgi:hypothetical protein